MKDKVRRMAAAIAAMGFLASAGPGCAAAGRYFGSRALDLYDILPVSVSYGIGGSVGVRATPFFQTSFGDHNGTAYGLGSGRWGSFWEERRLGFLLLSIESRSMSGHTSYNWPGGPDRRYSVVHGGPYTRTLGNMFFFIPIPLESGGFEDTHLPPWHAWADIEADFFLGIAGIRLGVSPDQVVDFLAGIFGFDLFGDDIQAPEELQWVVFFVRRDNS